MQLPVDYTVIEKVFRKMKKKNEVKITMPIFPEDAV